MTDRPPPKLSGTAKPKNIVVAVDADGNITWDSFLELVRGADIPGDFLTEREGRAGTRDPY